MCKRKLNNGFLVSFGESNCQGVHCVGYSRMRTNGGLKFGNWGEENHRHRSTDSTAPDVWMHFVRLPLPE